MEASRDAFKAIAEGLTGKRKEVFDVILRFGPISNEEIAARLGWKVQSVCGRVYELRGWLYDNDLKKSVLHEDKIFVIEDSYVRYRDSAKKVPDKKSGIRWKATDAALKLQRELF